MSPLPGVALAGASGAVARYLVDRLVTSRYGGRFPAATLLVNTSGALVLGLLTGAALYQGLGDVPKAVLGTGFCGAYTTFSTFSVETARLAHGGRSATAVAYVVASVVAGLVVAGAGIAVMAI